MPLKARRTRRRQKMRQRARFPTAARLTYAGQRSTRSKGFEHVCAQKHACKLPFNRKFFPFGLPCAPHHTMRRPIKKTTAKLAVCLRSRTHYTTRKYGLKKAAGSKASELLTAPRVRQAFLQESLRQEYPAYGGCRPKKGTRPFWTHRSRRRCRPSDSFPP